MDEQLEIFRIFRINQNQLEQVFNIFHVLISTIHHITLCLYGEYNTPNVKSLISPFRL